MQYLPPKAAISIEFAVFTKQATKDTFLLRLATTATATSQALFTPWVSLDFGEKVAMVVRPDRVEIMHEANAPRAHVRFARKSICSTRPKALIPMPLVPYVGILAKAIIDDR